MKPVQTHLGKLLISSIKNHWLFLWTLTGIYFLLCGLTVLQNSSSYHKALYALLIPPTVLLILNRKNYRLFRNPIIMLYIIFITFACISTLTHQASETKNVLMRAFYTFSLFATACFCLKHSIKYSISIAVMAGYTNLVTSLNSFVPWLYEALKSENTIIRFIGSGALTNPLLSSHLFGFYTVIFLFMAINAEKNKVKIIYYLTAFNFLTMTIATGSRTPLLALTACLIWLSIISPIKRNIVALIAFITLIVATYFYAPDLILNRGLSYRPELWNIALEKIKNSPIFGYGFGAETNFYIDSLKTVFREPHNIHLSILYFTGISGFILWTGMHLLALYTCIQNKNKPLFILASCLIIYGITAGMTEGGGLLPRPKEHWFITWIPLALVAALIFRQTEQQKNMVDSRNVEP